ncbi:MULTISPECIES: ABC transporter ATP-binding protein [unclassified Variovorax]|uniref:ABC transporter ATP-binding protein n=1 Tax=unclassified Variovorax TaxID=663243 RepID=UPI001BD291C8|nr:MULTISPECIES: ABC transporter ATP-binding protein [unclassified Variovorax]
MNALEVSDLHLSFGGVKAVAGVSFDVRPGQIFSIVGPNGAGKTSVLNMISRMYDADAGRVVLEGRDITAAPAHTLASRGLARTFQNLELCKQLSVTDNALAGRHTHRGTTFWAELLAWPTKAAREQANRDLVLGLLKDFGLARIQDALVGELPYGYRKLLEVVRALSVEPRVLLLDEPVAGLNTTESNDMARRLLAVREKLGISIVLIEHDMKFVREVSDAILVMNWGKCLTVGKPDEVLRHPEVIAAYLGSARDE